MGERTIQISCGSAVHCCATSHMSPCTKKYGRKSSPASWISGAVFVLLTVCMVAHTTKALPVNDVLNRSCKSESCRRLLQLITQTLPSHEKASLLAARVSDIYSRSFSSEDDTDDVDIFNNIKTDLNYLNDDNSNKEQVFETAFDDNRDNIEWLDRILNHVTESKWDYDPLSIDEREVEYHPDLPTMSWGPPLRDSPEGNAVADVELLPEDREKRQQGWYIEYGKRSSDSAHTRLDNVRGDSGSDLDSSIQQKSDVVPESILDGLATRNGQFGDKSLGLVDLMSTTRSQRLGLIGKLVQLLKNMPQIKAAAPSYGEEQLLSSTDLQTKSPRDASSKLMREHPDHARSISFNSDKDDASSFNSQDSRGHVFKFNRDSRSRVNDIYGQNVEIPPVTKKRQQGWYIQYGKRNENRGGLEF